MIFLVRVWRRFSILGKLAIIVVVLLALAGLFADFVAIYSYDTPSGSALLPPSSKHWLGTDDLGIDLWAQLVRGARSSIMIGLTTAIAAGIGGSALGMLSGYYGGFIDRGVMRLSDVLLALPDLPVVILLSAFLGASPYNIIIVLVIFSWSVPARMARSKIIALKEVAFILAAKSVGANFLHLAYRHFGPILFPLTMLSMIKILSKTILLEAGLSFLGLGDPLSKSWGLILHHAMHFSGIYFTQYWKWWVVSPVVAIVLLTVSIGLIGRDLERVFNTKL